MGCRVKESKTTGLSGAEPGRACWVLGSGSDVPQNSEAWTACAGRRHLPTSTQEQRKTQKQPQTLHPPRKGGRERGREKKASQSLASSVPPSLPALPGPPLRLLPQIHREKPSWEAGRVTSLLPRTRGRRLIRCLHPIYVLFVKAPVQRQPGAGPWPGVTSQPPAWEPWAQPHYNLISAPPPVITEQSAALAAQPSSSSPLPPLPPGAPSPGPMSNAGPPRLDATDASARQKGTLCLHPVSCQLTDRSASQSSESLGETGGEGRRWSGR